MGAATDLRLPVANFIVLGRQGSPQQREGGHLSEGSLEINVAEVRAGRLVGQIADPSPMIPASTTVEVVP